MENEPYNSDSEIAFNQAIVRGDVQKARELIAAGFDVNNRAPDGTHSTSGWTPLHMAVEWNRAEIIRLLLDHGADIDVKDCSGATPLMNSVSDCIIDLEVVQLLIDRGANLTVTTNDLGQIKYNIADLAYCADEREGNKEKVLEMLNALGVKSRYQR